MQRAPRKAGMGQVEWALSPTLGHRSQDGVVPVLKITLWLGGWGWCQAQWIMGHNVASHDMLRASLVSNSTWAVSFLLSASRRTQEETAVLQGHAPGMLGFSPALLLEFGCRKGREGSLSPAMGCSSVPHITVSQLQTMPTLKSQASGHSLLPVPSLWKGFLLILMKYIAFKENEGYSQLDDALSKDHLYMSMDYFNETIPRISLSVTAGTEHAFSGQAFACPPNLSHTLYKLTFKFKCTQCSLLFAPSFSTPLCFMKNQKRTEKQSRALKTMNATSFMVTGECWHGSKKKVGRIWKCQ